jgi:hypothetical protein
MIKSVLTEAILAHDFHFSFVEYYKIRVWVEYLNPCAEMVSSITIVSDIEKIKEIMGRTPNRICLTLDVWTTTISEGYSFSSAF